MELEFMETLVKCGKISTDYEHSPNYHLLKTMVDNLSQAVIQRSQYKDESLFADWYKMVLCYDFAHAESDYDPNDVSKMEEWVFNLAESSWKKTDQKKREKLLLEFHRNPSSVNQWGNVSNYLSDCMDDLL